MSYDITEIQELRRKVSKLEAADLKSYEAARDDFIINFMPHTTNRSKDAERKDYQSYIADNENIEAVEIYEDIWRSLLPDEQLAIEHLYFDDAYLVAENTGFYREIHAYIYAKNLGNSELAKQHLKNVLWEVLYNSLPDKNSIESTLPQLFYDKIKRRRKAQMFMLNGLGISTIEIHTPDYITDPIRQQYNAISLEELLPEIVFPLEENAKLIAEEIQEINYSALQQLLGKKSIISEAETIPEATQAFAELYINIIEDGTRDLITNKLEELAKKGRTEEEIIEHIDQEIEKYQDVTIPNKMDSLASHFNGTLSLVNQRDAGITHYKWITMGDDKVRSSHAANDGKIFSWNDSPKPGEEHNCRCIAEPVVEEVELAAYRDWRQKILEGNRIPPFAGGGGGGRSSGRTSTHKKPSNKPFKNKTPKDKDSSFRKRKGQYFNEKDGSVWEKDNSQHGGSTWKRWKNVKDWEKGKKPQSIRPDGSVRK